MWQRKYGFVNIDALVNGKDRDIMDFKQHMKKKVGS
jgi:hypothetical protein